MSRRYGKLPAACAHCGVSRATMYRWLGAGYVKAVKAGRNLLIDFDSLDAYLATLPAAEFRAA